MIRIPNSRKDFVSAFCRKVSPGQVATLVSHQPLAGKPLKECFSIVPEHIDLYGGKQKFGWAVFELKRIWLEAEFHVVWERDDGMLVDLTPREVPLENILFVPDPKKKYEGTQVDSIFKTISNKPSVKEFIDLTRAYNAALNEGDLANIQSGPVDCPKAGEIQVQMDRLMQQIVQEHFG